MNSKHDPLLAMLWALLFFSPHATSLKQGYYRLQLSCTLRVHQLAHHKKKASALSVLPLRRKQQRQAMDGFWSKLGPSFNCSKASAKPQQELPVSGWSSPLCANSSRAIHSLQQECITGGPPGHVLRASPVADIPHDLAQAWFGALSRILSPYKAPFF